MRAHIDLKPSRRCLIRAGTVIAVSLVLTLLSTREHWDVLRSVGILCSVYGCTWLISKKTYLGTDVLNREFGRGYDAGYADGLAVRREEIEAELADAAVPGVVLPFDRAVH